MTTREEAVDIVVFTEKQLLVEVMNNIDAYLLMVGATEEEKKSVDAFVKRPVMHAATRLKHLALNLSGDAD